MAHDPEIDISEIYVDERQRRIVEEFVEDDEVLSRSDPVLKSELVDFLGRILVMQESEIFMENKTVGRAGSLRVGYRELDGTDSHRYIVTFSGKNSEGLESAVYLLTDQEFRNLIATLPVEE